jgi:hypothetical protein
MAIVFGNNHFLIKSYSLVDVGIYDPSANGYRLEYRQKYFHLYFLPTIPTGKFWALRKPNDNNYYEISQAMHEHIQSLNLESQSVSWYHHIMKLAFPFLILCGFGIYQCNEVKSQHDSKVAYEKSTVEEKVHAQNFFDAPTTRDYYKFRCDHNIRYCRVTAVTKDSIRLQTNRTVSEDDYYRLDESGTALYRFFKDLKNPVEFWTTKEELNQTVRKTALAQDGGYASSFEGAPLLNFHSGMFMVWEKAIRLEGPDFKVGAVELNTATGEVEIEVKNTGFSSKIVEIVNKSADIDWKYPQKPIAMDETFMLSGKAKKPETMKSEIVCRIKCIDETTHNTLNYNLMGFNSSFDISRLPQY